MGYRSIYRRRKLRVKWAFCQKGMSTCVVHGRALVHCSQRTKNAFQACIMSTNQGFEKWSTSICVQFMQVLVSVHKRPKVLKGMISRGWRELQMSARVVPLTRACLERVSWAFAC
jgi:hypothetical protein